MSERCMAIISYHSCPLGRLGGRDTGGMNVYVREVARELGAQGYAVDIYTRAHDLQEPPVMSLFEKTRLIHIRAGWVGDMGKAEQFRHLAEFVRNVTDFVSTDGVSYDLIHSHYWLSGLAGQRLSETWGVPQIMMFHTLGVVKNDLPVGERESEVRLKAERDLARACRHIVVATEDEWGQIGTWGVGAEKVSVVPCGVDLELFRPTDKLAARRELGLAGEEEIILSVGRIEPLKGLERLVEAFSILHRPGLKLLIVGGDTHSHNETARLKALAVGLGVGDRLEFYGAMAQERLSLYYNAADVTVVASYYESFCLIILESLACGTPVVSTGVGVAPAVIDDTCGMVAEGTPQSLAQAIARVLDRGQVYEAEHLRRTAAPYSWTAVAERLAKVYQAVLVPGSHKSAV